MATVNGRYPGSTPFDSATMRPRLRINEDGSIAIYIDDADPRRLDFWMEVRFAKEEVAAAKEES